MTVATDREIKSELELVQKSVTIDEFLEWEPENSEVRHELRRGVIFEMPEPRGTHSEVATFIRDEFVIESRRQQLDYLTLVEVLVTRSEDTAYRSDLLILDRSALVDDPLWQRASTVENGSSIKLVLEVVSSNWQDDYETKMAEYEAIGIPEYWIVDYLGLGGIRHLGKPKQPTLTICTMVDGEYLIQKFRGDETIVSQTFPELKLIANQILR
jgi:Uma2 family endonuclease